MSSVDDPLFEKIHSLAVRLFDGSIAPGERDELASLLLEDRVARRVYLEYVQESACLRWLCLDDCQETVELARPKERREKAAFRERLTRIVFGGSVACLLMGAIGWWLATRTGGDRRAAHAEVESGVVVANVGSTSVPKQRENGLRRTDGVGRRNKSAVATITGLGAVTWEMPNDGRQMLSRCAVGERLRIREGSAVLTFDAGAQVTVFGPADFEITSATSIRCRRGRVTTLVDHRGKGFSIETPQAKVVDLGTQFGLSISDKGETEVVVFQGSIDLSYNARKAAGDASGRRMQQGDALLLKDSGEVERLVSVQRNRFMSATKVDGLRPMEPVIGDVRDNIRKADSIKSYQIVHGGLDEDVLAFVDRNHQWNGVDKTGLPPFLVGADYIMPFNDDKFVKGLELKVRLLRPATLYVFLDDNMAVPSWLQKTFTNTGLKIGLDCAKTEWHRDHSLGVGPGNSIDFKFSIWKRDVEAGIVTLGGIERPPAVRSQGFNMYGIAAVATK